tara:strand:+ start:2477 stop:2971 length:495 start_codon:yes stop_codon:yes gene_type:complete
MNRCALYRHFDADGALLYVGITNNPQRRLAQHVAGSDWMELIATTETQWFGDRGEALTAEAKAIQSERPKFNKTYTPAADRKHADLGDRIRQLRLSWGMSQCAYSLRFNFNQTQLSNWEIGIRRPTIEAAIEMCDAHNVSMDWIFRGLNCRVDVQGQAPKEGAA